MRVIREAVTGLGLLLLCGLIATQWGNLPDRVPVHFDLSGHPDGFGSKTTLIMLPVVAVLVYLLLSIVVRFPQWFNYPVAVSDLNRKPLQSLAIDMVGWLKAEIIWIFAWITIATVAAARGHAAGLGNAFLPISLGVIALTVAVYWYRMTRTRATP